MVRLSDLYDADQRTRSAEIRVLARAVRIPHPLRNVQYADGIGDCRHARKHKPFELCPWPDGTHPGPARADLATTTHDEETTP